MRQKVPAIGSLSLLLFGLLVLDSRCLGALSTASPAPSASSSRQEVLRVRLPGEPATLDWQLATANADGLVIRQLMEGLTRMNAKGEIEPALARQFDSSADGKRLTFRLRPDVAWSDGAPFTAHQVVAAWKRLLQPVTGAPYASLLYDVTGAAEFHAGKLTDFAKVGILAPDALTVEVHLDRRVPYWPWIAAFWAAYPIREEQVARQGSAWTNPGALTTIGPYALASHDLGQRISLRRNPRYFDRAAAIEKVELVLLVDDSIAIEHFDQGRLDVIPSLPLGARPSRINNPAYRTWPELRGLRLDFNVERAPLRDGKLRKLIAAGLDTSSLARANAGACVPAGGLLPPALAGGRKAGIAFDPAHARIELRKGGYADSARKLELATLNSDEHFLLAEWVQGQLAKNLGLAVELRAYDARHFHQIVKPAREYAMVISAWGADYPDPDSFFSIFHSLSGNNRTGWKDPRFDAMIGQARGVGDPAARGAIYRNAEKLLLEEAVATVPLCHSVHAALVRPGIKGFVPTPIHPYRFWEWALN